MDRPRVTAIVPAGGRGSRMGGEQPKQYLLLGGQPLLWHTLDRFEHSPWIQSVLLVVRPEDMERCRRQVLEGRKLGKVRELVPGGQERWESVLAGLRRTEPGDELVLVHDAVRPFFSEALLERVICAAAESGAAIAGLPVKETVKVVKQGVIVRTPEREGLWRAQTPQGFWRELLLRAYEALPRGERVTDDAMVVERLGHPVRVVEGEEHNLKITTPEDLAWAEWFLSHRRRIEMPEKNLRVGQGFDVHRLEGGRRLVLGGVSIPFERGLVGHSDADVLTHAVIDALLGAAACGDIGRRFPDTDPQYRGICSLILLGQVRELLAHRQVQILNIDVVVMAQRPRLASYVEEMSRTLAAVLKIPSTAISIKATTTEQLGFVGREEGIAAQAVALIEM